MALRPGTVLKHAILVAFSAAIVLPLLWVLRVSLTDKLTAYKIPPEIGRLGFENYVEVFTSYDFTRWFSNSLIVALWRDDRLAASGDHDGLCGGPLPHRRLAAPRLRARQPDAAADRAGAAAFHAVHQRRCRSKATSASSSRISP